MEIKRLYNGVDLPLVGLGTHGIDNDKLGDCIGLAYSLGYRKFDTAWLYGNEKIIGDAIKKYAIPRSEIFLTSKLHINNLYFNGYHNNIPNLKVRSVKRAFEASCKRLGTDYLDLYLIHWPFPYKEKMWEELEKLYSKGRIRAIGVSSFLPSHIEELMLHTDLLPHVNQYEVTPINTLVKQTLELQSKGIHTEAYSLFGTTKTNENASVSILGSEIISDIALTHGKSPSQIILRWAIQRGFSVIPRSKSIIHLKENLDIFDFSLTNEEMESINKMNRDIYSRGNPNIQYFK